MFAITKPAHSTERKRFVRGCSSSSPRHPAVNGEDRPSVDVPPTEVCRAQPLVKMIKTHTMRAKVLSGNNKIRSGAGFRIARSIKRSGIREDRERVDVFMRWHGDRIGFLGWLGTGALYCAWVCKWELWTGQGVSICSCGGVSIHKICYIQQFLRYASNISRYCFQKKFLFKYLWSLLIDKWRNIECYGKRWRIIYYNIT